MGRRPCCSKEGLNRGAWSVVEDQILMDYIKLHGEGNWRSLPQKAGLNRCGKSSRLRWLNYLRPDIKRGNISHDEEELILRLHKLLGNRWSLITGRLPGRTDNEIKNYWNTKLGKRKRDHPSSSSAPNSKHSKQSENEKNEPIDELSAGQPKITTLVRTKASRCTKIFIVPTQPRDHHQVEEIDDANAAVIPPPNPMVDSLVTQKAVESEPCSNGLSSLTTPVEDNSLDFIMNLNVGDLCLSELLGSEFSQLWNPHDDHEMIEESKINGDNDNWLCPSLDQSIIYTDVMPEDWTRINYVETRDDTVLHLGSLASFLDSGDD
ncbi:PREDICTED: myb-related protein Myb4-like [Nelumbo nucifera]|uniref:Myb-related protein Myb4-like n=2 Tax=Nelumbo nucifera TaxID=4432 RepID=A0A1U7Z3P9_NELNU|nr:PREDICTED: myb-related protein Myb4-like [Nelumbo nucifera]DAD23936.1 TPA_asm: hypothetical protein HUJ06_025399 [Nelumbo nucifera]